MDQRATHDRRALLGRLHLPERRTGFDRRRRHAILGQLRDDPQLLAVLLGMFVLLSLLDGALTAFELATGIASEGNPFLSSLIAAHPVLAACFKLVMTGLVAFGIWHGRRYRKILAVSVFALVLYAALLAYHLGWLYGSGVA